MVSILSVLFIHLNSIINILSCLLLAKLGHLMFVDVCLILFIMMMQERQPVLALEDVTRLLGRFCQLATPFLTFVCDPRGCVFICLLCFCTSASAALTLLVPIQLHNATNPAYERVTLRFALLVFVRQFKFHFLFYGKGSGSFICGVS